MKRVWLYILLAAEAALCIIAALLVPPTDAGGLIAAQQIPFAQAGMLLRSMSLLGGAGNAFAIVLYIIICCIPAAFLLIKFIRKRAKAEDAMLAVISGYMFYLMYMMINPGKMGNLSVGSESFGKAALGGVFWSLLIGWLVLKLLRFVKSKDTSDILRMLGILFTLAAAIIMFYAAYVAVYAGIAGINADIKALQAYHYTQPIEVSLLKGDNIGIYSDALIPEKIFIVFRYAAGLIPFVLDVLIFLKAGNLTGYLRKDRYGKDAVDASGKLASLCRYAVVIIILSSVAVNLLQVLFSESLRSMNFNNTIPLDSIILAIGMLLLSRYFAESRKLKQENEAFV